MKAILRNIALVGLIGLSSTTVSLADGLQCRHGIAWTISQSKAWGLGKPVITRVQPYSSSAEAGLKVGDIIDMIDGYATERLSPEQIQSLLESKSHLHTLKASRLGQVGQKYILGYHCRPCGSLGERELAELFSLYSIEDASLERIIYPYNYSQLASYPLVYSKYFSLAPSGSKTASTDSIINQEATIVLEQKGLSLNADADLVLSSYYELTPLQGEANGEEAGNVFSWRYDRASKGLKPFPLYGYRHAGIEQAKYRLNFGLQLQSRESKKVVWSCEATEYLSEAMSIAEYAKSAIATMLTGFPYVVEENAPKLRIRTLRYNYTGLVYSSKQMNLIVSVEDKSPAMQAGLRPGDIIRSINGQKLQITKGDALLEHYFKTAERLERHRDKALPPLKSLVGDIPMSYWRVASYDSIASILEHSGNSVAFSYIFAFRPYILSSKERASQVIYEIERDGETYFVPITPEYRDESTVGF